MPSSVKHSLVKPLDDANITTTDPNVPVYVNIAVGVHTVGNHYRGAKTERAYALMAEKAAAAGLVYASDFGGASRGFFKRVAGELENSPQKPATFYATVARCFPRAPAASLEINPCRAEPWKTFSVWRTR